jgi:SnoaL-like protein
VCPILRCSESSAKSANVSTSPLTTATPVIRVIGVTADTSQRTTVQRILHATDKDITEFLGFFTDTTVFRFGRHEVIGREAIAQWVGGYMASVVGTTHDVLRTWESDEAVAVRMDVTYRMSSGQTVVLPAVVEIRVDAEKVTHYLIFADPSPVVEAS